MSQKFIFALLALSLTLGGCAATTSDTAVPEQGDPNYLKASNARADALYVNMESAPGGRAFREIFIAPANLSGMQIVQPEGTSPDDEWKINDIEDGILQNVMAQEFSAQLGFESAYNIVNRRADADMFIHTTIVAIHPYVTRAEVAAGEKKGGALTISLALVNAETGEVMVRSVDTRSTDNIWAFNELGDGEEAVRLMFRAWGNSLRRGLLSLQGRSNNPLDQTLLLKEQE
jgi:hypothetical protein